MYAVIYIIKAIMAYHRSIFIHAIILNYFNSQNKAINKLMILNHLNPELLSLNLLSDVMDSKG